MNNFKSTSPTNLILSSLVSEFWQRIQIQAKVFCFFLGGGGWGYEHKSRHFLYIRYIVTTSCTEPYSLMKIFLRHCSFNNQGKITQSIKMRVVILVRDTSSWPVLHNCQVTCIFLQTIYKHTNSCSHHYFFFGLIWMDELKVLHLQTYQNKQRVIMKNCEQGLFRFRQFHLQQDSNQWSKVGSAINKAACTYMYLFWVERIEIITSTHFRSIINFNVHLPDTICSNTEKSYTKRYSKRCSTAKAHTSLHICTALSELFSHMYNLRHRVKSIYSSLLSCCKELIKSDLSFYP